jgi:DnaA family protein
MRQLPLGVRLRDRASFQSFHPASNLATFSILKQIAAAQRSGVFWLAGPRGSGKSHLLQALCVAAAHDRSAAFLPLRELAPNGPAVLGGWSHSHCVCVDDIDAVLGDLRWERALFNLHRELEEQGATLLISAMLPPRQLKFALPDLASRCAAALLLTLNGLNEDEQRAALQLHAEVRGLELPAESANYLMRRVARDMEQLVALLEQLDLAALAAQRRLTIPFVREVLERQT